MTKYSTKSDMPRVGMNNSEIARELGITRVSVQQTLKRAIEKIKNNPKAQQLYKEIVEE